MGGDFSVESEIGQGTTFEIRFKFGSKQKNFQINVSDDSPFEFKSKSSNGLLYDSIPNESKPRILLANDEIFILRGLSNMLKMQFRIETAENGWQAVNLVEKNPLNYF